MSDEITKELADVFGIIEINSFGSTVLWERCKEAGIKIEHVSRGFFKTVGLFHDHPVCISINFVIVNGKKIMLYHDTSVVVNHNMIINWLQKNLSEEGQQEK